MLKARYTLLLFLLLVINTCLFGQDAAAPAADTSSPKVETAPAANASSSDANATPEVKEVLQKENIFREESAIAFNQLLDDGRKLLAAKDYPRAQEKFDTVMRNTDQAGTTKAFYDRAAAGRAMVSAAQGVEAENQGKYTAAQGFFEEALKFQPNNPEYTAALARIHARTSVDEEKYGGNKSVTPDFIQKVKHVQQLIFEGDRFLETGQLDIAKSRYQDVLRIDPYNKVVIAKLQRIEDSKFRLETERLKTNRDQALLDVEKDWSDRLPPKLQTSNRAPTVGGATETQGDIIRRKLDTIKIQKLNFEDVDIAEAITFLQEQSRKLDETDHTGVNFVLKLNETPAATDAPAAGAAAAPDAATTPTAPINKNISLSLTDVPLSKILEIIKRTTGLQILIEENAVFILPPTESSETFLQVETFTVPPNFFTSAKAAVAVDVRDQLTSRGISFPKGSSASYFANTSKLVVRGTRNMLNEIYNLLIQNPEAVSHVMVEARFVDFVETKAEMMRFNWVLGADSTIPAAAASVAAGFPAPGVAGSTTGTATSANTLGLRGVDAIPNNTVDALLTQNAGHGSPYNPAQLTIGGLINGQGLSVLLELLSNNAGSNLLSAPRITLQKGAKGTVRISQEFIYPKNYTAPQMPQANNPAVIPSSPTDFNWDDPKNVGVVMKLEVQDILEQPRLINLAFTDLAATEFSGFINYGADITEVLPDDNDNGVIETVVKGVALMPVFTVRRTQTHIQVRDGHTVVMGGFIRDDTRKVDDKVPVLGDLPLLGKLFRSKVDQRIKRNLIILVTATLVDADGQPRYPASAIDADAAITSASAE